MSFRVVKTAVFTFVLRCAVFSGPVLGVEMQPSNLSMPASAGELFSFDFVVSNVMDVNAAGFKTTIDVSGPGTLDFNIPASEAVAAVPAYWIYGNSIGAVAKDNGGNNYEFGDGPDDPPAETLNTGDIVARYAFLWDGTEGDYTFTLDLGTSKSYVLLDNFTKEALEFDPGQHQGGSNYFTVCIPEPTTLLLFGLGAVILRKRRG